MTDKDEWIVDAPLKTFHSGVNTDSYFGQIKDALGERPAFIQQRGHYKQYSIDTPDIFYGLQNTENLARHGHKIKKFHDRRPIGYGLQNAENLARQQDQRNFLEQKKNAIQRAQMSYMKNQRRGYGGQALQFGLNALGAGIGYNMANRGANWLAGQTNYAGRKRFRSGYERQIGNYGRYNRPPALPANTQLNWCPRSAPTELKYMDRKIFETAIDTGGNVYTGAAKDGDILTIVQNTGPSERIGRMIIIRELHWNVNVHKTLQAGASSANTSDEVRIMLLLDTQCNGALPAVDDILGAGDAAGNDSSYQSYMNLVNKGRFIVLINKRFCVNCTAGAGTGAANDWGEVDVCWEWHKNVCIPIEYGIDATGDSGVIAGIKANNIVCLMISKHGLCSMESLIRIRYDG